MNRPSEKDYTHNEGRRLRRLASLIRATGLSPLDIGRATNLDKRTIQRALRCEPLKSDAQARIEYFLDNFFCDG